MPTLTPSLSSVSPTSYPADTTNHTMRLFGSNFQSGDTLTFTPPEGGQHRQQRRHSGRDKRPLDDIGPHLANIEEMVEPQERHEMQEHVKEGEQAFHAA